MLLELDDGEGMMLLSEEFTDELRQRCLIFWIIR